MHRVNLEPWSLVASIHLDFTENVWSALRTHFDHALTICHLSLQSTALEQKHFDLESLLPVLPNLWLLLVLTLIKVMDAVEI